MTTNMRVRKGRGAWCGDLRRVRQRDREGGEIRGSDSLRVFTMGGRGRGLGEGQVRI